MWSDFSGIDGDLSVLKPCFRGLSPLAVKQPAVTLEDRVRTRGRGPAYHPLVGGFPPTTPILTEGLKLGPVFTTRPRLLPSGGLSQSPTWKGKLGWSPS